PLEPVGAVDLVVQGELVGAVGKPLTLVKTSIASGPLSAGVSGTLTPHDNGLRLDALFTSAALPCAELARMGEGAPIRSSGTFKASGVVKYDTSAPDDASLEWLTKETCGVSISGP